MTDLSWLLSRGYAENSSLKLVGDRFNLDARQRRAVARSACSDQALARRTTRELDPAAVAGARLQIDGFNLITTIEAALSGGVLLLGRDGALRDMASMHGSYRRVEETEPALRAIGRHLERLNPASVHWWLDRPVSNSGRLRGIITEAAADAGWPWQVELHNDPDRILRESKGPVATADAGILDSCDAWLNLARRVAADLELGSVTLVDFTVPSESPAPQANLSCRDGILSERPQPDRLPHSTPTETTPEGEAPPADRDRP